MSVNRVTALGWALGLGFLSAIVASRTVSAQTPGQTLRHVAGFTLLFVPALFAMITRQWDCWVRKHPAVRFAVFFLSAFTAIVVLGLPVRGLVGGSGVVGSVAEILAAIAGFGVAAWITLYGGAERIWLVLLDRLGVEW